MLLRTMCYAAACWLAILSAACDQAVDQGPSKGGTSLTVTYAAESKEVDLETLSRITLASQSVVSLSAIVEAAFPGKIQSAALGLDFVGADGFRPSAKSGCRTLIPVPEDLLDKGGVTPVGRNLLWDASLGYGGCMQVKDLDKIVAVDIGQPGKIFHVIEGDRDIAVDLRFQQTVDVGGVPLIPLQSLIKSSGASSSPEIFTYDFEGSDGFRPVVSKGADLLPWETLAKGTIHPATGDLSWDASLGLPSYWAINDAAKVYLVEPSIETKHVLVVFRDQSLDVDLGTLATVDVGGEPLVVLQTIVQASGLTAAPADLLYDLEGSDGYRPTVDRDAEPLAWAALEKGWLSPVTRNATFDASLGLAGYWSVSDVARIHLVP